MINISEISEYIASLKNTITKMIQLKFVEASMKQKAAYTLYSSAHGQFSIMGNILALKQTIENVSQRQKSYDI
jgi:hypothetical protein